MVLGMGICRQLSPTHHLFSLVVGDIKENAAHSADGQFSPYQEMK